MQLTKETAKVGLMVVINNNIGELAEGFTKGKPYVILYVLPDKIRVRDDRGTLRTLYFRRFDIFEENKVKYWVCIKGSINAIVGSRYAVDNTLRRDNLLLINGRWQSISRFAIIEIPEQAPPKKEEKPAPPPKSLAQLLKEAQDKEGYIGMCSYAIMNDKGEVKYQVNDICHARIRPYYWNGPFIGVSLMVEEHAKKIRNQESPEAEALYLRAIDYILHRSPWSSIYINKDFKNNFGCVDLDVNRGIHAVACAAIALRTCSEYTSNNTTFCALVDAGVNEHVAYIVAHSCIFKGVGNNSGSHHVFSISCTLDSVLSFFKTGKFIDEGTPYKDNKERYSIIRSQFVEDIHNQHKDKQLRTWLIDLAAKLPTFKKEEKWGAVVYKWDVPNNLIPLAYKLEKEFHNV